MQDPRINFIKDCEMPKVHPIFLDESKDFLQAVESTIDFLKKWSHCYISDEAMRTCTDLQDIHRHLEMCAGQTIVIFLSDEMTKLLGQENERQAMEILSPHRKFVFQLLKETDLKDDQMIFVNFHHPLPSLKCVKVFHLTKLSGDKVNPNVEMNIEDIHQLVRKICQTNIDLTSGWSRSREAMQMLEKMKIYQRNIFEQDIYNFRPRGSDGSCDLGFESMRTGSTEIGNFTEHILYRQYPYSNVTKGNTGLMDTGRDIVGNRSKIHDTAKWTESQNQRIFGYPCHQNHSHIPPQVKCPNKPIGMIRIPAFDGHNSSSYNIDNNNVTQGCQREKTRIREAVSEMEFPPSTDVPTESYDEWDPPIDDDTESISFSVICERQQELNDTYLQNLNLERRKEV